MKDALSIRNLTARPGERSYGFLTVPNIDPAIEIPAVVVNGKNPGPTFVVTAGIHGAEYAGIEAARIMGTELDAQNLSGQVLIAYPANPVAFYRRTIYTSGLDDQDLFRAFPGREDGTSTDRLAYFLYHNLIMRANIYVDVHGGDMNEALVPFVAYHITPEDKEQVSTTERLALAYGIKYIVQGRNVGATYVTAARAGIPAFLAEAGGQGVVSEEGVQIHLRGLRNILRASRMLPGEPTPVSGHVRIRESHPVRSTVNGFYYPSIHLDQKVEEGQSLGRITDPFGKPVQEITAPKGGHVLWVVTSLAINAGDPLLSIAVPEE